MFTRIAVCLGWIVLTNLACLPVAALQPEPDWTRCANESRFFTLDEQIAACTAILQSGREGPASLAIAHQHRLSAFRQKRESGGDPADPAAKLKLNTSNARAR